LLFANSHDELTNVLIASGCILINASIFNYF
jgi:hypothetical protein